MLLGDIIKQYRSEHNLSMQNFADLIHSSKSYVSMLEKNLNPSTNKPINPSLETLKVISEAMHMDINDLLKMLDENQEIILNETKFKEQFKENIQIKPKRTVKVSILGYICAGIPIDAITEIVGDYFITEEKAKTGKFFALKVKGDSMFPYILEDDIVLFRQQNNCENGQICAVMVNGDDATIKIVKKDDTGITLIPYNPTYPKIHYSNEEIIKKPVIIAGVFEELQRNNLNGNI